MSRAALDDMRLFSLLWLVIRLGLACVFAIGIVHLFYNLFLHPLRDYPGPFWNKLSRFPYVRAYVSGNLPFKVQAYHQKYGSIVRIAPDELSFTSPSAWKEIYGHRSQGQQEFEKYDKFYRSSGDPVHNIISARREEHGRLRRLLSHGFSDKSMREQEPIIQQYIDLLIQGLHKASFEESKPVNMVSWYNWTTFDIIGDLAFGEPFGCLANSDYHPWIAMLFASIKAGTIFQASAYYPLLRSLFAAMIPKSLLAKRDAHVQMTREKVMRRIENKEYRPDFFASILRKQDELNMTVPELISNGNLLIIAGSETTATLLSGVTYLLLSNPKSMTKLEDEVRSSFMTEKDINVVSVNRLSYMSACLEEALRMYTPIPMGLPRVVPKGGSRINGQFVPGNTVVSIYQWAANHDIMNFVHPWSYIPERFLGDERFTADRDEALQPFSIGPRNCLGRNLAYTEMRLILARVIYNFDMRLDGESTDWIKRQKIFSLWEKIPLKVHLAPRKPPDES